ncbi:hypothetical protein BJ741DRAFT_596219, partial [Chytriomyces cf. hyalinus JEL632]
LAPLKLLATQFSKLHAVLAATLRNLHPPFSGPPLHRRFPLLCNTSTSPRRISIETISSATPTPLFLKTSSKYLTHCPATVNPSPILPTCV